MGVPIKQCDQNIKIIETYLKHIIENIEILLKIYEIECTHI